MSLIDQKYWGTVMRGMISIKKYPDIYHPARLYVRLGLQT